MKKIRIGNDIKISWYITNKKDGSPYSLEGKRLKMFYGTYGVSEEQTDFTVTGNMVSWTFYGKDQKKNGDYHLTLIENQGDKGMVTVDACSPFCLVPTSCMAGGESSCGNVSIETVEIQSEVDVIQTGDSGVTQSVSWSDITNKPTNFADWNAEEGEEKFISNKPVIPSKTSDLDNDSEFVTKGDIPDTSTFVTNTVDNLLNYYLKSETYTKEEVKNLIGQITTINFSVVESLPGTGEPNIIYLVKKSGSGNDVHDEYIWVDNKWEIIGSTAVDLTNYYTKADADGLFALKTSISDMLTKTDASATYQPKGDYALKSELPDTSDFATKNELEGYVTSETAESTYAKKEDVPEAYTLPIATAETLGGVKVGAGLSINPETGVLSATGGGTADSVDWSNITSKPDFKTVATSGSYNDLSDKPSIPANTSELNNDSGFITSIPEEYVTETELEEKGYATQTDLEGKQDKGDYALKSDIPDISSLATKQEVTDGLSSKADVSAISDMETKTNAAETYQPKGNYATKDELSGYLQTATAEETYAKKSDVPSSLSQLQNDVKFITYTDYVSQ